MSVILKEKEKQQVINRQASFELLRIVSMFLIVVFHFHDWGGIAKIAEPMNNKLFGIFIGIFGNLGNNLFILISGYFLINSKFKTKKLLKIYFQIYFYSILIFVVCYLFEIGDISRVTLKQSIFPISYNAYWFATTYLGLYLLFPYINKFLKTLNQEKHRILIILLGIILSVIPTILLGAAPWSSNLAWFIYLYVIAAYMKLYDIQFLKEKPKRNVLLIIIALSVMFLLALPGLIMKKYNILNTDYTLYFYKMYSLPMLLLSLLIFMFFKNINIKGNGAINFFAKSSFAVYLIHINAVLRIYLFNNIIKIQNFYNSKTIILIGYVLGVSILIYVICSIIDYARRELIEKPLFKIKKFDKYFEKLDNLVN